MISAQSNKQRSSQNLINNQNQQAKQKLKYHKKNDSMSILQKLKASKNKNIDQIDLSYKIKLFNHNNLNNSNLFLLKNQYPNQFHKHDNQPYLYTNLNQQKVMTFNPVHLNTNQLQSSKRSNNLPIQTKQNISSSGFRQRYLNPTQSWNNKFTPQKLTNNTNQNISRRTNSSNRQPLNQISIHEQLYLQSRKKQIKRSAQQIIQNQYFKKIHPFKPEMNSISQFLAQQKLQRLKQRQKFQNQFQQFDQWKQQQKYRNSLYENSQKNKKNKDGFDLRNQKQLNQKQTQLKNYTILQQFFYYLTQNNQKIEYVNLNPQRLCQLPEPCIKLLGPIIEQFYKNKKNKSLTWHQFLSQFNIKINKKKAFYTLIQKWFKVKFGVKFDRNGKVKFYNMKQNSKIVQKSEDSTNLGQSQLQQEIQSHQKSKRTKNQYIDY